MKARAAAGMKGTKYHIHGKVKFLLLLLLSFCRLFCYHGCILIVVIAVPVVSAVISIVLIVGNKALSIVSLWLLWLYTLFFLGVIRPAFELENALFDMKWKKVLFVNNQPSSDSVNLLLRFQKKTRTLLRAGSSGRNRQAFFVSPCHHRKDASESSRNIW
jgi:hypothetical protein